MEGCEEVSEQPEVEVGNDAMLSDEVKERIAAADRKAQEESEDDGA